MIRLFAFLLIFLPFLSFSQKTKTHFGYSIEYKDSVFYLVDSTGNHDTLGAFIEVDIDRFKKAIDTCNYPEAELLMRIIKMYEEPRGCPTPSYRKQKIAVSKVIFENNCLSSFTIQELIQGKNKIDTYISVLGQIREEAIRTLKESGFSMEFKDGEDHFILFTNLDRNEMIQLIIFEGKISRVRYLNKDKSEIESFEKRIKKYHTSKIEDMDNIFYYCPNSSRSKLCNKVIIFTEINYESKKYHAVSYGFRN